MAHRARVALRECRGPFGESSASGARAAPSATAPRRRQHQTSLARRSMAGGSQLNIIAIA